MSIAAEIGISKRELFEEYYLDEFITVLDERNGTDTITEVEAEDF